MKNQTFTLWYRFNFSHKLFKCFQFTNEFTTYSVSLDYESLLDHIHHIYIMMKELEKNNYKGELFMKVNNNMEIFTTSQEVRHLEGNILSIHKCNTHDMFKVSDLSSDFSHRSINVDHWVEL